ncbi:hypothetical protein [Mesorhizobium sp. L-8-3]|uniref:hypothetical protein n=1 Tax=Mesorhizobium sp. L-8-3 TaxID=2744522 RepID=UPI001927A118|nr:hypothetical protein [Mesorhizobium sp. L-8-3]BCH27369.1 hypothetical protein MesoLjLb_71540 [Mesorhizobium sp. L-8-3]
MTDNNGVVRRLYENVVGRGDLLSVALLITTGQNAARPFGRAKDKGHSNTLNLRIVLSENRG